MDHLLPRRMGTGLVTMLCRNTGRILRAIHQAHERTRQRRALARLSDGLLWDIGLTHDDVIREAAKPFWRR